MSNLKEKTVNAIIWTLLERYGVQVFGLVIGIILARLLTPADYGLIGMIGVFFVLANVFVNSGFGTAYIQKKDATETDASTIFYFNITISVLFYFIFWFASPLIATFYNQPQLVNLTRVSAVVIIIGSFGMMQNTMLTKAVNFKKKTIISLVSTLISGIIGIFAALSGYGVWSLVFQQMSRSFINVCGLWLFYSWKPTFIFSLDSLKSMFSFGSWILMTNIIRTIFDNIYILTIGKFFPVAQLGFYTKAKGYQKIVSQQPASAISVVSFPVFTKLQDDKVALKNSMRKFITHTLFFISPIIAILIIVSNPLILIVLTEKWMPMVPYFQLLLVVGFLYPIHLINVQMLIAQGKSKLNFRISVIKNIIRVLNIIIMYRYGVVYIIYGEIAVSLIGLFINGYYTKAFIKYGMWEQLKDLSKTFFITGLIVLIGFFVTNLVSNSLAKILIGFFLTGGSYLLFQFIFNKLLFIENIVLLRSKIYK